MITARPIATADFAPAANMVAARQRRLRAVHEALPAAFEDHLRCEQLLRDTADFCDGVVAEDSGHLVGVLFGFRQLTAPSSRRARFAPPREATMLAHSHAVAPNLDAGDVYGSLYARLAEAWVTAGILAHTAHVPAGEPAVNAAWADLGFGRGGAFALRRVAEPLPDASHDVEVRVATVEDLDVVHRLIDEEARFHAAHRSSAPTSAPRSSRRSARSSAR